MNKLMGFLELKEMSLPSIPWKQYTGNEKLDEKYLWTIRSAVYRGEDLNLPRLVGEDAENATKFADTLLHKLGNNGMVIFYPYFIANKSGTLEVKRNSVIIEAVTYSDHEVTIIYHDNQEPEYMGNKNFLKTNEKEQLLKYVPEIKKLFKDDLLEGKSALLEWSFAVSCDINKKTVGDEYLVFYEARTVK